MQLLSKILKRPELDEREIYCLNLKVYDGNSGSNGRNNNELSFKNEAGVLKNKIAAAEEEARKILARARAEAEEYQQEYYRKGFEKGYHEGLEKAAAEAEEIKAKALDLLRRANEGRRKIFEEIESEIIDTAVAIAKKIVCSQLSINPESVVAIAKEAISLVADRENVVVSVNPEQQAFFQSKEDELKSLLSREAKLRIIADPNIKQGGCAVITESGEIDATLDTRWAEMMKVLG